MPYISFTSVTKQRFSSLCTHHPLRDTRLKSCSGRIQMLGIMLAVNGYYPGGFTGHTNYAVDFLHNVQQVEIHFESVDDFFEEWKDGERKLLYGEQLSQPIDEQIESFWRLLTTLCPRLTHVVVREYHLRRIMRKVHKALFLKCLATLNVPASYLQRTPSESVNVKRHLVEKPSTANDTIMNSQLVCSQRCSIVVIDI